MADYSGIAVAQMVLLITVSLIARIFGSMIDYVVRVVAATPITLKQVSALQARVSQRMRLWC